ncbi:MAG TPA: fused MFS/spermidine synthase [Thermoguttaceae bacterium]|nr:fused MFS/spermidine synthase [Thermoguttaceae bacterium]HPP51775.1 fused MFS/spermidine synthase [Thermoguttaceae bacterium]
MVRTLSIVIVTFGSGWILMGLEILAGRMLAPTFGNEIYVWGSIIGVFLAGLSVGYVLGGVLSKLWPSAWGMVIILLLAAGTLLPVGFFYGWIADGVEQWGWSVRWGSLAAAAVLFLPPSVLLGMISPYAVRLTARRMETVGLSAGLLYAVATVGSFLGCILTAFYFILWFGIRTLVFFSALGLVGLALVAAVAHARASR